MFRGGGPDITVIAVPPIYGTLRAAPYLGETSFVVDVVSVGTDLDCLQVPKDGMVRDVDYPPRDDDVVFGSDDKVTRDDSSKCG